MKLINSQNLNEEIRRAEKMLEQLPSWKASERLRASLRILQLHGMMRRMDSE